MPNLDTLQNPHYTCAILSGLARANWLYVTNLRRVGNELLKVCNFCECANSYPLNPDSVGKLYLGNKTIKDGIAMYLFDKFITLLKTQGQYSESLACRLKAMQRHPLLSSAEIRSFCCGLGWGAMLASNSLPSNL